jgi:HD-GYP domain-containing protein (c-di-GMP phosphodiesterase class II)/GGDEF domain-containing protein
MRLVAIDSVEPGSILARDVWGGSSGVTPLLRTGTVLRGTYLERLSNSGIAAVYIDDELSAGIEIPMVLRASTHVQAGRALEVAFTNLPGAVAAASGPLRAEIVGELRSVISAILDDLEECGDAMLAFTDLATVDAYTMQHSIDVTVLGLLLGKRLFQEYGWVDYEGTRRYDRVDERLTRLGMGLLLHDIGKVTVPAEVLNKKGPLDELEWELIRKYPAAGAEMLTDETVGARAKSVVRFHHERFDGTGYPVGLKGDGIPQLARIAAVADVFDAITSARPYRNAAPAFVGVDEITKGSRTHFDPEVVSIFRQLVAPHPVGTYVTFSDGREGIVMSVPPARADRPVVRVVTDHEGKRLVTPLEVPLIRHPEIEISSSGWPAGEGAPETPRPIQIPVEPEPKPEPEPAVTVAPVVVYAPVSTQAPPRAAESPAPPAGGFPTDPLTGFGMRQQLEADLILAVKPTAAPSLLVLFDLDGTGAFEKSSSRVYSEALLRRLAVRVSNALGADATCYRSRVAELSALIRAPIPTAMKLAAAAATALGAQDGEEPVAVRFGTAVLPEEAHEPLAAILLADTRRKLDRPSS